MAEAKDVVNCADRLLGAYYPRKMRDFFCLGDPTSADTISPLNWSISADGRNWNHGHPGPESVAGGNAPKLFPSSYAVFGEAENLHPHYLL